MAYIMGPTFTAVCMLGYHLQVLHHIIKAFFSFFSLKAYKTFFFLILILFLVGLFVGFVFRIPF